MACHWLRGEQEEARRETRERRARLEKEGGDEAIRDRNPNLVACEFFSHTALLIDAPQDMGRPVV